MKEADAISAADSFLLKDRGVAAEPIQVVLMRRPNEPTFWVVRYGTFILFPKETAAGSTVDGGDYILTVDDASGEVGKLD